MKRTVLDTNIIISSALGGALVLILERWDKGEFTVIVTSDILREYFEVLNRPKFKLKQETIDKITRYIYQFSEFVILKNESNSSKRIQQTINFWKQPSQGKLTLSSAGIIISWTSKNFARSPSSQGTSSWIGCRNQRINIRLRSRARRAYHRRSGAFQSLSCEGLDSRGKVNQFGLSEAGNIRRAQKPWIVPIPGTTKLHRLEENIRASAVELTSDDLRDIGIAAAKITVQGARRLSEPNMWSE